MTFHQLFFFFFQSSNVQTFKLRWTAGCCIVLRKLEMQEILKTSSKRGAVEILKTSSKRGAVDSCSRIEMARLTLKRQLIYLALPILFYMLANARFCNIHKSRHDEAHIDHEQQFIVNVYLSQLGKFSCQMDHSPWFNWRISNIWFFSSLL